jgi:hypothetical protein
MNVSLSCECCVLSEVSSSVRSLAQRSPTKCSVSVCDRGASIKRRPWPIKDCCPMRVWNIHMHQRICEGVFLCICVCVCVIYARQKMCRPLYFFKRVLLLFPKLCFALYNKCIFHFEDNLWYFFMARQAPVGQGPHHWTGFMVTLIHNALSRIPLYEWSAQTGTSTWQHTALTRHIHAARGIRTCAAIGIINDKWLN